MNENAKENTDKAVSLPFFGIPKLLPFLHPYRKRIVIMVLLGCVTSAVDAVYPLFNRYALNHFVGEGTLDGLPLFILSYVLLLLGQTLVTFKSCFDCSRTELDVNRDLRNAASSSARVTLSAARSISSATFIRTLGEDRSSAYSGEMSSANASASLFLPYSSLIDLIFRARSDAFMPNTS